MDGHRFDEMARALVAGAPSRRATLQLLAGGGLAVLLGRLDSGETAAACRKLNKKCSRQKRCCAGARCKGGKCRCKPGRDDCDGNGRCESLRRDDANCGECGNACGEQSLCQGGECRCNLTAELNGQNEVDDEGNPGQGDDNGTGFACVVLNRREVCWKITVQDIAPVTAAHIHEGAAAVNGPVRVDFSGQLTGCVAAAQAQIDAIEADPDGFYVNVHNGEFANGAIRGQLGPPSP